MQKVTFSLDFTFHIKIYALIICSNGTKKTHRIQLNAHLNLLLMCQKDAFQTEILILICTDSKLYAL